MAYYGDGSNLTGIKDGGARDDIALLGFKVAANGSFARYNLVDQSIDAFEDASGVDASASINEIRDGTGNYYSGSEDGALLTTLTSGTSYTTPAGVTGLNILMVGGGGGGSGIGGGGGGGGIVHHTSFTVTESTSYTYAIGAGAAGTAYGSGAGAAGDTTFSTLTAKGGGGASGNASPGVDGGSAGGGNGGHASPGGSEIQTSQPGDSGTYGYGNDGGDGNGSGGYAGGGGGGAAAAGGDGAASFVGGIGGAGKLFSDFTASGTTSGNVASGGSDGGYYGGGGGGANSGAAGVGGGGAGGGAGANGVANTGGGGGGSAESHGNGGTGANGIIVIREANTYNNMTLISNAITAEDGAPDNGDLVITYTNGIGTATINTDIKAYISRDGSAYTSAVTLVDQGDTGGHTILTANGVDISGIASGTSMRWKIETLNQSATKATRIQAVSLGWS